jgi:hypothetical protein
MAATRVWPHCHYRSKGIDEHSRVYSVDRNEGNRRKALRAFSHGAILSDHIVPS